MPNESGQTNAAVAELAAIKHLMVLALSRMSASQEEIAKALGVNQSTISRMLPNPPTRKRGRR